MPTLAGRRARGDSGYGRTGSPARNRDIGAGCVQSHGDDEMILVLLYEPCDTALGDGEGVSMPSTMGRPGLPFSGPSQSTAIHAKRARTTETGQSQPGGVGGVQPERTAP